MVSNGGAKGLPNRRLAVSHSGIHSQIEVTVENL
jgi:hypothetical protein